MEPLGDKSLRIAFAGAGAISGFHLTGWQQMANCQVVAICDTLVEKAQAQAQAFGIPAVYADFDTMLSQVKPDAVDIAIDGPSNSTDVSLSPTGVASHGY